MRQDPSFEAIARKLNVTAPPDIDRLYPQLRPARVTVTTARGAFTRQADEALGSRIVPLDDAGLRAKFLGPGRPCARNGEGEGIGRAHLVGRGDRRRGAAGGVDGEVAQASSVRTRVCCEVILAASDEFIRLAGLTRLYKHAAFPVRTKSARIYARVRVSAWMRFAGSAHEARDDFPFGNLGLAENAIAYA